MSDPFPGYRTVLGSEVERDGMYLELIDEHTEREVALVFYSDSTQEMTVSILEKELPLNVVELFIERAKRTLPPNAKC